MGSDAVPGGRRDGRETLVDPQLIGPADDPQLAGASVRAAISPPPGTRVLVTGGHGFIGRPLTLRLAALGCDVMTVSRRPHPDGEGVVSKQIDLTHQAAVDALFAAWRPEVVLHLASHVVGVRTPDAVMSTFHNNLTGTVHVLLAAHAHGCRRVVLTGSLEEPDPDNEWPVPSSPYAAAKLAASMYGRMFHALFDVSVVTLRLFMVYGPGQADLRKLVPYTITSLHDRETPAFSLGQRNVDWVYVDDVVEAYLRSAVEPGIEGMTLDVGTGEMAMVRTVVERLFAMMGREDIPQFGGNPDRAMEQVRRADVDRTTELLGWRPKVTLEEGLRRTVEWYTADR